jgi:hypothetical protein
VGECVPQHRTWQIQLPALHPGYCVRHCLKIKTPFLAVPIHILLSKSVSMVARYIDTLFSEFSKLSPAFGYIELKHRTDVMLLQANSKDIEGCDSGAWNFLISVWERHLIKLQFYSGNCVTLRESTVTETIFNL